MPNYKISGYVGEDCDIRLMRGNSFIGYKTTVPAGAYELVFTLDSIENIDVVAVRSDGKIVGYGGIAPVSTGDSTNITVPVSNDPIITRGTYNVPMSGTSFNITIPSTNWAKSTVFLMAETKDWPTICYFYVNSLSPTNINAVRYADNISSLVLHWSILTYPAAKAIYRGIVYGSGSVGPNISIGGTINTSKSLASVSGFSVSASNPLPPIIVISNSTQLHYSHMNNAYLSWQVVEFN